MRRVILFAVLFAAGSSAAPSEQAHSDERTRANEAKLAKLLNGYVAGPAQDCLPIQRSQFRTKGVGDTLLYSANRNMIYRTETQGCSGVERGDALVTYNYSTQLCRGQIATTVDTIGRFQTGSCALGAFVPYRRVK